MKSILKESISQGVQFKNCRLKDVNFQNTNLRSSDFSDFEFINLKFLNSNLELMAIQSIKVCKSNKCNNIEESSNFGNILEQMDNDD